MNKIFKISHFSLKKILSSKNFLFSLALIIFFFIFIFQLISYKTSYQKPQVLIAIEDNSLEIGAFLYSVTSSQVGEIIDFAKTDFERGEKEVRSGQAEALIRVKKDTVKTLYKGQRVELELYLYDDKTLFSKALISYINSLIEVLNTSQNAGVIYMTNLKNQGYTDEERQRAFRDMELSCVKTFLNRDRVFQIKEKIDIFDGQGIAPFYYYSFILFFIAILDLYLSENSLVGDKKIRKRLGLSSYKYRDIYLGNNIAIILSTAIVGLFLDNMAFIFKRELIFNRGLKNAIYILIYSIILRLIFFLLDRLFENKRGKRLVKYAIVPLVFLVSGLIIPSYFLPFQVKSPLKSLHTLLIKRWVI